MRPVLTRSGPAHSARLRGTPRWKPSTACWKPAATIPPRQASTGATPRPSHAPPHQRLHAAPHARRPPLALPTALPAASCTSRASPASCAPPRCRCCGCGASCTAAPTTSLEAAAPCWLCIRPAAGRAGAAPRCVCGAAWCLCRRGGSALHGGAAEISPPPLCAVRRSRRARARRWSASAGCSEKRRLSCCEPFTSGGTRTVRPALPCAAAQRATR